MNTRTVFICAALVTIILVVTVAIRIIGGGEQTFTSVKEVLKTNSFVVGRVGSLVRVVDENDGPMHVELASDGHRSGYYSVTVKGPKGKESWKVYWRQFTEGKVEVDAIYKTEPFKKDELLWGVPGLR